MKASLLMSCAETLNAKVAAITLAVGAFLTLLLTHAEASLAPLRILALAIAAFAAWAFCDEMGLRKPLNRAGFVFFAIAVIAKLQISLGVEPRFVGVIICCTRPSCWLQSCCGLSPFFTASES